MQDILIPTNVTKAMSTSAILTHFPCVRNLAALRILVLGASLPAGLRSEQCNHHNPHNRNEDLRLPKTCIYHSHL